MTKVLASEFSDSTGCYDNRLDDGKNYYAELSTNPDDEKGKYDYSALGKLKKNHKLKITYGEKSEYAFKGDVGRGKKEKNGEIRRIDLHSTLAKRLGFNGLDYVTIENA